jgi:hypothetical protein
VLGAPSWEVGVGEVVGVADGGAVGVVGGLAVVDVVGRPSDPPVVVCGGGRSLGGGGTASLAGFDDGASVTVLCSSGSPGPCFSGLTFTAEGDAEDDEDGEAAVNELSLVAESLPGTVLEGAICWEPGLLLPPLTPEVAFDGVTSWAMPPKAVASTTPLTASRT